MEKKNVLSIDEAARKFFANKTKDQKSSGNFIRFLEKKKIKHIFTPEEIQKAYSQAVINNFPEYPAPSELSEEEKQINQFQNIFWGVDGDDVSGVDYIRYRCMKEIPEIKGAKYSELREDKIKRIIDDTYQSCLDQFMGLIETIVGVDGNDKIEIPDTLEEVKKKIDELLPGINSNFKKTNIFKSTEDELTIKNEMDAIILEIQKMGVKTRSVKPYLQVKLKEGIWKKYKDENSHPEKQTALGLLQKEFARKYFWEYGIEETKRYKNFGSFYKNIFLK